MSEYEKKLFDSSLCIVEKRRWTWNVREARRLLRWIVLLIEDLSEGIELEDLDYIYNTVGGRRLFLYAALLKTYIGDGGCIHVNRRAYLPLKKIDMKIEFIMEDDAKDDE